MSVVAITAAALSAFILGGLWYSPSLLLPTWKAASERGGRDFSRMAKDGHSSTAWALAVAASFVAATALAQYLAAVHATGVVESGRHGLWVGAAVVAPAYAINYAFGSWPLPLFLVDAGYHIAQF